MSTLYGALGVADGDLSYVNTFGAEQVFDAVQEQFDRINESVDASMGLFVSARTEKFKFRHYLPGGGYMQRHNSQESKSKPHAVRAGGYLDVALPIDDWRDAIIEDDIEMAYMTLPMLDRAIKTIGTRYANTMRQEILRTIFRSTARTFSDPIWGDLTVQTLANGDSVLYPPVIGSGSEATDNHLLESNYAYTSITDTNNPLVTMRDELTEHFGISEAGENILVVVNKRETPYLQALADFTPVLDSFVTPGDQTATLSGSPGLPTSMRLVGRSNGVWIAEWDWMPQGYMFARHMGVEAPLMYREDPAGTGLGGGLRIVAQEKDFPMENTIWRVRRGFGVANRLNGVVMELGVGGTYTVPTAYAWP